MSTNPHSRHAKQPPPHEAQSLLNLLHDGHLTQAESAARALLERYPDAPMVHGVLGNALADQGKFSEAIESFRKVVASDPKSAEMQFNLAVVLTHAGRLDEAVASYRKAVTLMPQLAVAHYNLGAALQAQGKFDEAAASYRKVVAIEPAFFEAHGNLGAVLQAQGKLDEAVACYRKALSIHADARGHFNLATALRNQGRLDEAVASYRKAIALDPGYAEAHSNLGEALFDLGKPEEAMASYHEALAVDPDHAEANYNLGIFLYDSGDLERAIPCFERSRLRDWRERTLYCLYKTERFDEFKAGLEPLLHEDNTSPFLATLSAHHAANFGVADRYEFCRNPLDFVYHGRIDALAAPDSPTAHGSAAGHRARGNHGEKTGASVPRHPVLGQSLQATGGFVQGAVVPGEGHGRSVPGALRLAGLRVHQGVSEAHRVQQLLVREDANRRAFDLAHSRDRLAQWLALPRHAAARHRQRRREHRVQHPWGRLPATAHALPQQNDLAAGRRYRAVSLFALPPDDPVPLQGGKGLRRVRRQAGVIWRRFFRPRLSLSGAPRRHMVTNEIVLSGSSKRLGSSPTGATISAGSCPSPAAAREDCQDGDAKMPLAEYRTAPIGHAIHGRST